MNGVAEMLWSDPAENFLGQQPSKFLPVQCSPPSDIAQQVLIQSLVGGVSLSMILCALSH